MLFRLLYLSESFWAREMIGQREKVILIFAVHFVAAVTSLFDKRENLGPRPPFIGPLFCKGPTSKSRESRKTVSRFADCVRGSIICFWSSWFWLVKCQSSERRSRSEFANHTLAFPVIIPCSCYRIPSSYYARPGQGTARWPANENGEATPDIIPGQKVQLKAGSNLPQSKAGNCVVSQQQLLSSRDAFVIPSLARAPAPWVARPARPPPTGEISAKRSSSPLCIVSPLCPLSSTTTAPLSQFLHPREIAKAARSCSASYHSSSSPGNSSLGPPPPLFCMSPCV